MVARGSDLAKISGVLLRSSQVSEQAGLKTKGLASQLPSLITAQLKQCSVIRRRWCRGTQTCPVSSIVCVCSRAGLLPVAVAPSREWLRVHGGDGSMIQMHSCGSVGIQPSPASRAGRK